MKQLTFLVKPASSLCGLRCRYCFYEDVAQCRETQSMGIMSHETAEHLLRAAAQAAESGDVIQITFQGGEPTLAGLDFFRDFVAMEGELIPSGVTVNHSIQTNGMAVTAEWAEFFQTNRFLVGPEGIQGRVARIAGQQRVIVELFSGCLVATAYIPKDAMEKIGK